MRKPLVLAGLFLLMAGCALAQDGTFPKVETSPAFMYVRTPIANQDFNCAGGGGTLAYNFTSMFGMAADLGGCKYFGNTLGLGNTINGNLFTFLFGPRITFRNHSPFTPFFDFNLGGARLSLTCKSTALGCVDATNGDTFSKTVFAFTAGGGFDIRLSKRFSLRPIQAEYLYTRFGNDCPLAVCNQNNNQNSFRLKSGIVIGWGGATPVAPTANCSVQPSEVMVGESVTATATGGNFNAKHALTYTWDSNGGKVTGKDNAASIDTNGVAGGSYTVSAHISDSKMKKGGTASCSASFTVKEPPKNPPQMSCSASPSSLQAGGTSTITCSCTSPDNVPVNVSNWTSTGGSVSGSGSTASLNTAGASAGSITVTATCTDSRGLNTQASTQANVENAPPAAPPQAQKLSQCDFPNKVKPWRVDNTCKAILDDVAKNLQQNAEARVVVVGNADAGETRPNLAAERAVNSKAYLTSGESQLGIDPSRVETRTGSAGTMTAEYWIVPAGGTYSGEGTQSVDESQVKAVPDHPAKKKAKAKAQQ
jgi:outer membrane protein OmpA-like peptidoglycan-associated protein